MQLGVCGGTEIAPVAAEAGFAFMEGSVRGILKPLEPESAFAPSLSAVRASPLPYPVLNGFIPGDLKIVGPEVNTAALDAYVVTTLARAATVGVDTIVFGSGGARRIPEGVSRDQAWEQLIDFCARTAPRAARLGVTIVVEPLQLKECNILTTVGECAELVRQVDHPALRLLVDAYHWLSDGDSAADLVAAGPLLRHAHIATRDNRLAPGAEPCDFSTFFRALYTGGYDRRLSFEGKLKHPPEELPRAFQVINELLAVGSASMNEATSDPTPS